MSNWKVKFWAGMVIVVTVYFGFLFTMITADDVEHHSSYAIVKHNVKGVASPIYYAHTYGVWFKVFGPGRISQVFTTGSTDIEETKRTLAVMVDDSRKEYEVIEVVEF